MLYAFFVFIMYSFKSRLSCLKVQIPPLGVPDMFVLLFTFFLLLFNRPTTSHGMVAGGSVGSDSGVICFPIV